MIKLVTSVQHSSVALSLFRSKDIIVLLFDFYSILTRAPMIQIAEDYSHCEFLIRLPGYCPSTPP